MPSPSAELASPIDPSSTAASTPAPTTAAAPPALLPIFLKLQGRKVLVVGGGPVAAAKIAPLRETGAAITVVAPELAPALRAQLDADPRGVSVAARGFQTADLDGAWLVIAAAPPEVNRRVVAAIEASGRPLFVVAVDDPQSASAYGCGTLRRGGVTVAISTDGQAPALAGLLREGLDAVIPADLDAWVAEARALRAGWRADRVPLAQRRPLLLRALNRLYGGHEDGG
jgi:uroporphyrin-III C-methyltransferase/precorrin-2 dehydrogenase/sirohydrochlorin ferrochelatase